MSRRAVLLLALATLALLTLAVAPWTLSGGGLVGLVAQHLHDQYGMDLKVRGRSTFALLPVPRVKLENVSIATPGGAVVAEGGTLRGEVRLMGLLWGRIEINEVMLGQSRITLGADPAVALDGHLNAPLAKRLESPISLRRLILTGAKLRWPSGGLDDVNVVLNWQGGRERIELAGSVVWRGEAVEISRSAVSPGLLAVGRPSPFSLAMTTPGARFAVNGEVQMGSEPRVTGDGTVELRSPRDFVRWSGVDVPLGSLMQPVSVAGEFSADRRRVIWPSVVLTLGKDQLEGSLTARIENGRPAVTGTLAANRIDLSSFFSPLMQARTPAGLWSGEDADVASVTGGDLDLRLSATDAVIGRLKLSDMAASVLVRPGRIEASLGRANLNQGTVKGRLVLSDALDTTDLKAHGTFDEVDLAAFLAEIGQRRWITGHAQGHFAVESSGSTVADLVRQANGRAAITVKHGELIGIGLNDALKRVEKRPLAASTEWKGGRTFFDQAQIALNVGAGVGEITEGTMTASNLRTVLQGRVSLIERAVAMRALVDPAAPSPLPSPLIALEVTGGWDDVAIVPDVKSLIERSGAAKPLLGGERAPPRSPPFATAQ